MVSLQQDPEGTPCRNGGGGVCTRLVVGYTWTWASLGLPTGLVHMAFNNWSMVAGWGRRCKKRTEGTRRRSSLHQLVDQAAGADRYCAKQFAYRRQKKRCKRLGNAGTKRGYTCTRALERRGHTVGCAARRCAQEPTPSSALFACVPKCHHLVWLKSGSGPITTCLRPFWWPIFTFVRNGPFSTIFHTPPSCWKGGSSTLSAPFLHKHLLRPCGFSSLVAPVLWGFRERVKEGRA